MAGKSASSLRGLVLRDGVNDASIDERTESAIRKSARLVQLNRSDLCLFEHLRRKTFETHRLADAAIADATVCLEATPLSDDSDQECPIFTKQGRMIAEKYLEAIKGLPDSKFIENIRKRFKLDACEKLLKIEARKKRFGVGKQSTAKTNTVFFTELDPNKCLIDLATTQLQWKESLEVRYEIKTEGKNVDDDIRRFIKDADSIVINLYKRFLDCTAAAAGAQGQTIRDCDFIKQQQSFHRLYVQSTCVWVVCEILHRTLIGYTGPEVNEDKILIEDKDLGCRERFFHVARAIKEDKRICKDLIDADSKIKEFVHMPNTVLHAKYTQKKTNEIRKSSMLTFKTAKAAMDLRNDEAYMEDVVPSVEDDIENEMDDVQSTVKPEPEPDDDSVASGKAAVEDEDSGDDDVASDGTTVADKDSSDDEDGAAVTSGEVYETPSRSASTSSTVSMGDDNLFAVISPPQPTLEAARGGMLRNVPQISIRPPAAAQFMNLGSFNPNRAEYGYSSYSSPMGMSNSNMATGSAFPSAAPYTSVGEYSPVNYGFNYIPDMFQDPMRSAPALKTSFGQQANMLSPAAASSHGFYGPSMPRFSNPSTPYPGGSGFNQQLSSQGSSPINQGPPSAGSGRMGFYGQSFNNGVPQTNQFNQASGMMNNLQGNPFLGQIDPFMGVSQGVGNLQQSGQAQYGMTNIGQVPDNGRYRRRMPGHVAQPQLQGAMGDYKPAMTSCGRGGYNGIYTHGPLIDISEPDTLQDFGNGNGASGGGLVSPFLQSSKNGQGAIEGYKPAMSSCGRGGYNGKYTHGPLIDVSEPDTSKDFGNGVSGGGIASPFLPSSNNGQATSSSFGGFGGGYGNVNGSVNANANSNFNANASFPLHHGVKREYFQTSVLPVATNLHLLHIDNDTRD
ncbi:hypothetical protein EJ04DRAFT_564942 [Polyplosphaeria fusca]|uniref:Uncharacterized protein n=1 Tax=Polyplosphaeria fusca TaxID=682080 RepID=A0A9P4QTV8_9PLEO|nr:hypothetical protein EJ04DRAFT_564942 [Polyplosphaeria fusca]